MTDSAKPRTATIKTTWAELLKHTGRTGKDMVSVPNLHMYGFDAEILNLMVACDILPQTYLIVGEVYVAKSDIMNLINTLLKNELRIYRDHVRVDALAAQIEKELKDNNVRLSPEVLADVQAGKIPLNIAIADALEAAKQLNAQSTPVTEETPHA